MHDKVLHLISNAFDALLAVPGWQWYTLGVVLASIPAVILILQWIKAHHFKVKAVELENHFIALNIVFWSFAMTSLDFVITNGPHFAQYLPFVQHYMGWIMGSAPTLYTLSKSLHSWFINRETETQQQRLSALGKSLDNLPPTSTGITGNTPTVTTSFGSKAAGRNSDMLL